MEREKIQEEKRGKRQHGEEAKKGVGRGEILDEGKEG